MADAGLIEAAGGVLWRHGEQGIEVCVVHRPKYDDWSLPKGKLDTGEHPLIGAVREVAEETGVRSRPGRPLGELRYEKDGRPKRVRYWAMAAVDGAFAPNGEVDEVVWTSPELAGDLLVEGHDGGVLGRYGRDRRPTWPMLLVRHGSAGQRSGWDGADRDRPLDPAGVAQAEGLCGLLRTYDVEAVHSADVARCVQTVGAFAEQARLPVVAESLMSERGFAAAPVQAVDRLLELAGSGQTTAVCSQGKAIPGLLTGFSARLGVPPPTDPTLRKGGVWVLHLARASAEPELVAMERFGPLG